MLFACGEGFEGLVLQGVLHDVAHYLSDFRSEVRLTCEEAIDSFFKFGKLNIFFDETISTCTNGLLDDLFGTSFGEHHDADARKLGFDATENFDAVEVGHHDVANDDIGFEF